jgi:hypothetical protein
MAAIGQLRDLPAVARIVVALEVLLGVGALFGGGALLLGPNGHVLGMSTSVLTGSPFHDFAIPGAVLFLAMGVFPLVAAGLTVMRASIAPVLALAAGGLLIGWIAVEMIVLAGWGSLAWTFYLLLGAAIAASGAWWFRFRQ